MKAGPPVASRSQVAALYPEVQDAEAAHHAALALCAASKLAEALALLVAATAIHPDDAQLWNDLGAIYWLQGSVELARPALETGHRLDPGNTSIALNLSAVLLRLREFAAAATMLRRAFAQTAAPALRLPLATALAESWSLDAARPHFRAALPHLDHDGAAAAHAGLSDIAIRTGRPEAAVDEMRRSLALAPDRARHSTLLRLLHFDPRAGRTEIASEHSLWADLYCPRGEPYAYRRQRGKRLRVAYLSGIFVGHRALLGAIVPRHDAKRFDVVCLTDEGRLPQSNCAWLDVSRLSNAQLAARIRELEIDVLVECDGHFRSGARLPLFAARAAPVQISLPIYPGSLGVPGLDFRITGALADPPELQPGAADRLLRLALYLPWDPGPLPPVMRPRRRRPHSVVFGSFSLPAKLNPGVIDCWSAILRRVPRSRLMIQHHMDRLGSAAVNPALRRRFVNAFERRGVDPARVDLRGALPHAECMALHNSVDIALDPFPYNGTLTSLSALSMQTPLVTLAGSTSAGRVGMSILSALGLDSLIACDVEQYVRIAEEVAGAPDVRAECGRAIRDALASARWDPASYLRELEAAYEEAWERRYI